MLLIKTSSDNLPVDVVLVSGAAEFCIACWTHHMNDVVPITHYTLYAQTRPIEASHRDAFQKVIDVHLTARDTYSAY